MMSWLLLLMIGSKVSLSKGSMDSCEKMQREYDYYESEVEEYHCNGRQYTVLRGPMTRGHFFVDLVCNGTRLECSTFPHLSFANWTASEILTVRNCAVDEPIACFLHKLNVSDVKSVFLEGFLSPLRKVLVDGLKETTSFTLDDKVSGVQRDFLHRVVNALPNLTEIHIIEAQIELAPRRFQSPSLTSLQSSITNPDIPPFSFTGLPNLDELMLSGDNLRTLHEDSFHGLTKLTLLRLVGNRISALEGGVFLPLVALERLYILDTFLSEVKDGVLQGLDRLEIVQISNTTRHTLKLAPNAFANLGALQELSLEGCQIQDLPPTVFVGSTIISLSLQKNNLEYVHSDVFQGQAKMRKLDLSRNKLKEVTRELFIPLKELVYLYLQENELDTFTEALFSPLIRLETLYASSNKLKYISPLAFQFVPKGSLSSNQEAIRGAYIDPGPYNGARNVKSLDLSHNQLDDICYYCRNYMAYLYELKMSHNNITVLRTSELVFDSSYITLDLSYNQIESVIVENDSWAKRKTIPSVLLTGNPFNCDCNIFPFVKLANSSLYSKYFPLHDVKCASPSSLHGKVIDKVHVDDFVCKKADCPAACDCAYVSSKNITKATCADLDFPLSNVTGAIALKLNRVPKYLDKLPFGNVEAIELSGLNLTELTVNYELPSSVRFLNLSNNSIHYMPSTLLSYDVQFALSENALACDCWHNKQIGNLLRNVSKIEDFQEVKCADGTLLSRTDAARLCDLWMALSIGGTLAFLGIILGIIVYKYSFELKIYIAKYLPCLLPEEKFDASKKYDVFISYAHQDEEFVLNELLAKLEGSPNNLQVCVHYRDWLAGETIPYNIAKSVEESRRTVIVLSEHFLGSIWGLLEFRAAHIQATREGRARVVIILLQDVTTKKDLDREIKAYLNTNTYIKWGDPWFWEKLIYALPKRGKLVNTGNEMRLVTMAQALAAQTEGPAGQLAIRAA